MTERRLVETVTKLTGLIGAAKSDIEWPSSRRAIIEDTMESNDSLDGSRNLHDLQAYGDPALSLEQLKWQIV